ncbi:MAG: HIT domain-containing protein [Patescibacteria group bacterium]
MEECVFCKIVNKEEPTERIIFEDQDFLVFPSKFPSAETHLLLIPKKHILSMAHVSQEDADTLGRLLVLSREIAELESIKDYKLVFNIGKYLHVSHLHLHLVAGNLENDRV